MRALACNLQKEALIVLYIIKTTIINLLDFKPFITRVRMQSWNYCMYPAKGSPDSPFDDQKDHH